MEKAIRLAEIERKKADLRRRMEEASKLRHLKKGFMTPERKKKLRLLLRRKAAEELKKEQERKAEERRWIIQERCGEPEDTEWASKGDLIDICEYYYQRILGIEADKWDIEYEMRRKALEILDLNVKVNDLRGKFQKPTLKKISKFENKFAKLQRKAAEFNFKNQLMVKRANLCKDDRRSHSNRTSRACSPVLKMTARCASCNYPLTISDSVVCYECTSYFHIDCAQLVGFPFYPQSNTFHCSTCKHLPLPRPADSDSDSDREADDMPSRQLDYNMEERSDLTIELNEVKGSVQDLSSLCKDMLREINELKSINLTLRCSVENLRHDSNRRDGLIADLQLRIEALEKNKSNRKNLSQETTDWNLDRIVLEQEEELERYSTPEPPEVVNNELGRAEITSPVNVVYPHESFPNVKHDEFKTTKEEMDEAQMENNTLSEYTLRNSEQNDQDWTWKGNDAIEIKKSDDSYLGENNDSDDDQNERYGVDQEWEDNVEKKVKEQREKIVQKRSTDAFEKQSNNDEEDEDVEESEEEEKTQYEINEMKLIKRNMGISEEILDEGIENYEDDVYEEECLQRRLSDSMENRHDNSEVRTELGSDIESIATFDERELSERLHMEGLSAIDESPPADDQVDDQELHLTEEHNHEDDWQHTEGGVDTLDRGEEDIHEEGECDLGEIEPRLESETHRDLESAELEEGDFEMIGEEQPVTLEGEDQGLRTSEDVEIVEPPAEPHHSESDLWDYLKDTVSSVHPSTVEEFLENLIGTLQHVPEEYFKPVIEANIKRANSPSVTDGEHLPSHEVGESSETMDSEAKPIEDEVQESREEITTPTDPQSDDGYSPVEESD